MLRVSLQDLPLDLMRTHSIPWMSLVNSGRFDRGIRAKRVPAQRRRQRVTEEPARLSSPLALP